jgi:beta-lactamase class A
MRPGEMRRASPTWIAVLGLLVSPSIARAQDYFEHWPADLQTEITTIYRSFTGEIGLYVKDLSTGVRYTHNSATPMYIASGVKVAVMVEVFRQLSTKQLTMEEEIVYGPDDVRDGAPVMGHLRVGTPVSIRLLVEAMITQSDNAATDMIMRRVGVPNVSKGLVKEGIFGFGHITTLLDVRKLVYKEVDPRVARLEPADFMAIGLAENMEARLLKLSELLNEPVGHFTAGDIERAFRAYYRTGYNSAPLDAMGTLLERLARGKLVSAEASKQMIDIMLRTQTGTRRVRAGLPPGTPLAHKTGTQYRRICDFGFFWMTPERPVVFAACVKGGQTRKKAEEVIAYMTQRTWAMLSPEGDKTVPAEVTLPFPPSDTEELTHDSQAVPTAVNEKSPPPPAEKALTEKKQKRRPRKNAKTNGHSQTTP